MKMYGMMFYDIMGKFLIAFLAFTREIFMIKL